MSGAQRAQAASTARIGSSQSSRSSLGVRGVFLFLSFSILLTSSCVTPDTGTNGPVPFLCIFKLRIRRQRQSSSAQVIRLWAQMNASHFFDRCWSIFDLHLGFERLPGKMAHHYSCHGSLPSCIYATIELFKQYPAMTSHIKSQSRGQTVTARTRHRRHASSSSRDGTPFPPMTRAPACSSTRGHTLRIRKHSGDTTKKNSITSQALTAAQPRGTHTRSNAA